MSTAEITLAKTADSKDSAENGELNGIASSREVSIADITSFKSSIIDRLSSYLIKCKLIIVTEFSRERERSRGRGLKD